MELVAYGRTGLKVGGQYSGTLTIDSNNMEIVSAEQRKFTADSEACSPGRWQGPVHDALEIL
jgi:hypothetical protein